MAKRFTFAPALPVGAGVVASQTLSPGGVVASQRIAPPHMLLAPGAALREIETYRGCDEVL